MSLLFNTSPMRSNCNLSPKSISTLFSSFKLIMILPYLDVPLYKPYFSTNCFLILKSSSFNEISSFWIKNESIDASKSSPLTLLTNKGVLVSEVLLFFFVTPPTVDSLPFGSINSCTTKTFWPCRPSIVLYLFLIRIIGDFDLLG